MSDKIIIEVDSRTVLDRLAQITERFRPEKISEAMIKIGSALEKSTKNRFVTSTAPDGSRWVQQKAGTVLARLSKLTGAYHPDSEWHRKRGIAGALTAKGARRKAGMKPLVESGLLAEQIRYAVTDGGAGVEVGTDRFADEWEGGAAVHQFGTHRAGKNHNITIPARPFLGLSKDDERTVLEILDRFMGDWVF